MTKIRYLEIDFIRGLSILAMVFIHTTVYYLSSKIAYFFWDYSQFAVAAFIFCSGYLYFQKTQTIQKAGKSENQKVRNSEDQTIWNSDNLSSPSVLKYIKKRIFRLLIPYYIFVPFFFLVLFVVHPNMLTGSYIIQSIFAIGGIDINWLVLLFIQFIFVMPFLSWSYKKNKIIFLIYSLIAIVGSILFIFYRLPFSWKWIMWLPWSVVLVFAVLFVKLKFLQKSRSLFFVAIVFSISYLVFLMIEARIGHTLTQYANKYPPTAYNLSYSLAVVCFIFVFVRKFKIEIPLISFLSKNSYSFYFIHYGVLILLADFFTKNKIHWSLFFLTVFMVSILVQLGINLLSSRILLRQSGASG